MNESLRETLKQLRLSGLLESPGIRLQEAAGHCLDHAEFLELIVQDELAVRGNRKLERQFKPAPVSRAEVAGRLRLVVQPVDPPQADLRPGKLPVLPPRGGDVLWLGGPGVGKSFMVQAIGCTG